MEGILDKPERPLTNISFWKVLFKWERNRFLFNLLLGGTGYGMFQFEKAFTNHGPLYWNGYWEEAIVVGWLFNFCYCFVYIVEFVNKRFNNQYLSNKKRKMFARVLLIIGVLLIVLMGIASTILSGGKISF